MKSVVKKNYIVLWGTVVREIRDGRPVKCNWGEIWRELCRGTREKPLQQLSLSYLWAFWVSRSLAEHRTWCHLYCLSTSSLSFLLSHSLEMCSSSVKHRQCLLFAKPGFAIKTGPPYTVYPVLAPSEFLLSTLLWFLLLPLLVCPRLH